MTRLAVLLLLPALLGLALLGLCEERGRAWRRRAK